MDISSLMNTAMSQGIWCALFVYLFYSERKQAKEREEKLTSIMQEQGKQMEKISNTLETINGRIDKVEEKLNY